MCISSLERLYIGFLEKLQRFESLLMKCKENIKSHIERNGELQTENEVLKQKETQKAEEINNVQVMKTVKLFKILVAFVVVVFCRKCIEIN
jgi:regulator of replication initiation timing